MFAYLPHVSGAFKAYLNAELEKLACTGSATAAAQSADASFDAGAQAALSCSEGDRKENVDVPLSDKVSNLRARLQKCSKSPLASAPTNGSDELNTSAAAPAKTGAAAMSADVAGEQPVAAKAHTVPPAMDSMMSLRERLDALKQKQ